MELPKFDFKLFVAEAIGVALLLFFGSSIVIFIYGEGSVVPGFISSETILSVLTGFLFGSVACLVSISPVGKLSGAHLNPAVSIAFWLRGKMHTNTLIGYIVGQMTGAVLGCLPLLLWGEKGRSIQYGITLPGESGVASAFWSEVFATGCLLFYLYIFLGRKSLQKYTPFGIPILYSLLNLLGVASRSGDSTNPARSFGPAFITGNFDYYWLYWVAPVTGVLLVTSFFKWRQVNRNFRMEAARITYLNSKTPESLKTGISIMKEGP